MRVDDPNYVDRLMLLSEYKYYMPNLQEQGEDEEGGEEAPEEEMEAGDDIEDADLEGGEDEMDMGGEEDAGLDDIDFGGGEEEMGDEMAGDEMGMGEEEVEIDVSGIVNSVEENGQQIDGLNQKIDSITSQLNQYIDQMMKSSQTITNKMSAMEKNINQQFVKRTPTPHEELMLRSMSSYPFNQKISDYWTPAKGGEYDYTIENPAQQDEFQISLDDADDAEASQPKEYILTDKDVDDYMETDVRDSL